MIVEKKRLKHGTGGLIMAEYIGRDAALDIVKRTMGDYATAWCEISKLPAANMAPVRHGKWFDVGSLSCRCSVCGCKHIKESNFCPNCGAKMDLGS